MCLDNRRHKVDGLIVPPSQKRLTAIEWACFSSLSDTYSEVLAEVVRMKIYPVETHLRHVMALDTSLSPYWRGTSQVRGTIILICSPAFAQTRKTPIDRSSYLAKLASHTSAAYLICAGFQLLPL